MAHVCAVSVPKGEPRGSLFHIGSFLSFSFAKPRDASFPGKCIHAHQTATSAQGLCVLPQALTRTSQTQGRSPALNPAVDARLAAKGLSPGADSCTQKFFLYYSSEIFPNSGFFQSSQKQVSVDSPQHSLLANAHCTSHTYQSTQHERRSRPAETLQGPCHWSRDRHH